MNTKLDINVPMITDLGGVAVHANFTYGVKTEVYESCLVVFNGIAYIFGGSNQRRQVSRVENCQLTNVASLNFEFKSGACASTTDTIYLCFRSENWKSCRKGSDPSSGFFVSMAESNFTHKYIRIAASPGEAQSYYYDMILVDKVFRELLFKWIYWPWGPSKIIIKPNYCHLLQKNGSPFGSIHIQELGHELKYRARVRIDVLFKKTILFTPPPLFTPVETTSFLVGMLLSTRNPTWLPNWTPNSTNGASQVDLTRPASVMEWLSLRINSLLLAEVWNEELNDVIWLIVMMKCLAIHKNRHSRSTAIGRSFF